MLGYKKPLLPQSTVESLPSWRFDAVVVGAGVAGLTFALGLPARWRVAVLTKGGLGESNTRYAQGGLSAPIGQNDTISLHVADTLAAGAGLSDPAAVRTLVDGAADAVRWLVSIGAEFDRDPVTGEILLGREAAHSRRRVLHAGGDATGAEIERALVADLRLRENIIAFEHSFALDLITENGVCCGVVAALGADDSQLSRLLAPVVALCAGGAGQLWSVTSNPLGATADGLAMAIRAGVAIADTEFVQFHPTVLSNGGSDPFLVSEAVRGEGAFLRDELNERFMLSEHEQAELAPRDVVARGIQKALTASDSAAVYLDLRHLDATAMRRRFPTISTELQRRGLDLATDLIPVAPAAHYFIGGVAADSRGITSMLGLLALGEASCTSVHGANRLASNSLLEGLVFGQMAADYAAAAIVPSNTISAPPVLDTADEVDWVGLFSPALLEIRERIQTTMSRDVSVVRDATGLQRSLSELESAATELANLQEPNRAVWQVINMATSAHTVSAAALHRLESRGAHYRSDYPSNDSDLTGQHSIAGGPLGETWSFGSLASVILEQEAVVSKV